MARRFGQRDVVIPWLVEHAIQLYFRYRVGRDGRTPVERNRGRAVRRPVCEFGEQVLYMPLKAGRGGKFDDRFLPGTYLGTLMRIGETIIGTELGALRARTVRRLPEDKRWSKVAVNKLKGTPWAPAGDDEEKPIGVRIDLPPGEEQQGLPPPMAEGPSVARREYLRKADFEKHGVTKGCQGCDALRRGRILAASQ